MVYVMAIDYDPFSCAVLVGQLGDVRPEVLGRGEAQTLIGLHENHIVVAQPFQLMDYNRPGSLLQDKNQVKAHAHNYSQIQAEEQAGD